MFATIFRFIGEYWILSGGLVGVVALCVFAPAIAATVARWLLGTELGRYLLLAALVIGAAHWAWEARFSAGYAAAVAEQARAAESARADAAEAALNAYKAGAASAAAIGQQREKDHAEALRARDRVIADLGDGFVELRDHWTCLPGDSPSATGPGSDDATQRRREGAGDLVQIADEADADLAACQAQLTEYQRIGQLRVEP